MSEQSFGKLGKVEVTVLEQEPFDVYAKNTSSAGCPHATPTTPGGGPADSPASPFDDDGVCGSTPTTGGPAMTV